MIYTHFKANLFIRKSYQQFPGNPGSRLRTFTAKGPSSIPDGRTKIPQASKCGPQRNSKQTNKKNKHLSNIPLNQKRQKQQTVMNAQGAAPSVTRHTSPARLSAHHVVCVVLMLGHLKGRTRNSLCSPNASHRIRAKRTPLPNEPMMTMKRARNAKHDYSPSLFPNTTPFGNQIFLNAKLLCSKQ